MLSLKLSRLWFSSDFCYVNEREFLIEDFSQLVFSMDQGIIKIKSNQNENFYWAHAKGLHNKIKPKHNNNMKSILF